MKRTAFIDQQRLSKLYKVGDTVLFPIYTLGNDYAPTLGRITAVLSGIGFLDVETVFGNIRVAPEDVVKRNDIDTSFLEDTSEPTWERRRASKIASHYFEIAFKEMVKEAFVRHAKGMNEIQAYDDLYRKSASTAGENLIKEAVSFVYKNALYWKQVGRQYAPTRQEVECGQYTCPKCKCAMRRTCYKKLTKLLACPQCLWLICDEDIAKLDGTDDVASDNHLYE
jgi:hypothetical protein